MKKSIFLKQRKPLIATILGIVFLVLILFLGYEGIAAYGQIMTMLVVGMLLLGYSVSFEINSERKHKKHFKLFGYTVFKQRLTCISPEFISVFSVVFKKDSEWGPVAAMGNQTRKGTFVIRFFKGNAHFTIWESDSLPLANAKASALGQLLNIEVRLSS